MGSVKDLILRVPAYENKWGESAVLVEFDYGKMGGRIIHMISHTHLQKGGAKGKYASALILTNILDDKVSLKMGLSKKPTSGYVSDWQTPQAQTQQQYIQSPVETHLKWNRIDRYFSNY